MRLWSLHPKHLDRQGLLALWREGLLARKVLRGETKGYKNHPQLDRFRGPHQVQRIEEYLHVVVDEAERRGYNFDRSKLDSTNEPPYHWRFVSRGQIAFEAEHLRAKLVKRGSPPTCEEWPDLHPMFVEDFNRTRPEPWEKG